MDDLNDPRISAFRRQRRLLIPAPQGYKPSEAEVKREEQAEARTEARAARLHLVGLTDAGMIVMGLVLAAFVVMFVVVLASHH